MTSPTSEPLSVAVHESPVGALTLVATPTALRAVLWPDDPPGRVGVELDDPLRPNHVVAEAQSQLDAYFEGRLRTFDLPLELVGTEFQRTVWQGLAQIPYGATSTYAEHARRIGRPRATRAVGAANGRNPLSIVLPCHRVIGADGSLTGFAGGIETKRFLLELEG